MRTIYDVTQEEMLDFLSKHGYSEKDGYKLVFIGVRQIFDDAAIIVKFIYRISPNFKDSYCETFSDDKADILQEEWIKFLKNEE